MAKLLLNQLYLLADIWPYTVDIIYNKPISVNILTRTIYLHSSLTEY